MSPAPLNPPPTERPPRAVAVYCGASPGTSTAFHHAAVSLGQALATLGRPLVYGGGRRGIMGIIASTVLNHGGHVTAVVPSAMLRAGGEGDQTTGGHIDLAEGHEKMTSVVVDSMHERKVEMVRRVCGFIGLPGGYGTFEEIMEAITWTQLGIHAKPVVIMNVLGFYDPLRAQIKGAIASGFIKPPNERLVIFIDGPPGTDPTDFDWGTAALTALDAWSPPGPGIFCWNKNTVVKL